MSRKFFEVGDWVQALEQIEEELPDGYLHTHTRVGGIGHVLSADVEGDRDWLTVFWERSGTTTDVQTSEIKRLCGP